MKFKTLLVAGVIVGVVGAVRANAALVTYDITTSATAVTTIAGTTGVPGLTPSNLSRGTGLTSSGATNSFSSTGWNDLAAEDYTSFGFTLDSGVTVTLTTIDFTYTSSNTGPANMALRSSIDGFAANLATFTAANAVNNYSLDVSSLGEISSSIEFRFVAVDASSVSGGAVAAAGTSRVRNSLAINGIPEPASALLGAIGLFPLLRRRRA